MVLDHEDDPVLGREALGYEQGVEPVRAVRTPASLEYTYTAGAATTRFLRGISERKILGERAPGGKVYVPSRGADPELGQPTSEQVELPPDLPQRLTRLRNVTDLPMAVGFGISTAAHVRQVVQVADAAIVGSAVMRRVAQHRSAGSAAVVEQVRQLVEELAGGLRVAATSAGR